MHYRYLPLSVTTPAGTLSTAPLSTPWPMQQGILKRVEIDVPPGAAGLVGLRLVYYGTVIYPWSNTAFLIPVAPSYVVEWEGDVTATGLTVQTYNLGGFPHTTFWRAEVWPVTEAFAAQLAGGPLVSTPDVAALTAVSALVGGGP